VNRQQEFVEMRADSAEKFRTAYALGTERLSAPEAGARWHLVDNFNAGEKLLENASLKGIFQANGCAVLLARAE
jgi:hypothetical protein